MYIAHIMCNKHCLTKNVIIVEQLLELRTTCTIIVNNQGKNIDN